MRAGPSRHPHPAGCLALAERLGVERMIDEDDDEVDEAEGIQDARSQ